MVAHYLTYWKKAQEYEDLREHVVKAGYGLRRFRRGESGDTLWIVAAPDEEGSRRRQLLLNQVVRNSHHARWIKDLYDGACQVCGHTIELPDCRRYSEVHHIQPLGGDHPGPDIRENMMCVCPNCHVRLDFAAMPLDLAKLKCVRHRIDARYVRYHNRRANSAYGKRLVVRQ